MVFHVVEVLTSFGSFQARSPLFDVAFFIFDRKHKLRALDESLHATSISLRVKLEEIRAVTDTYCVASREKQVCGGCF